MRKNLKTDRRALQTTNPVTFGSSSITGQAALSGSGLGSIRLRPELDQAKVAGAGAPTHVMVGVFPGYSIPTAGAAEMLYFRSCVPRRWDGVSDINIHVHACLAIAVVGASKDFAITISWEHYAEDAVVPVTSNSVTCVDVATGADAVQYQSFDIDFTINYDIDGAGNEVKVGEIVGFELDRVAPTSTDDYAGEIIILGVHCDYQCDKFVGAP